jgi:hypothetical protein
MICDLRLTRVKTAGEELLVALIRDFTLSGLAATLVQ